MRDEIRNKSIVIPNGIDDYWLRKKGVPQSIVNKEKLKLVYAGVIDSNKK